MVLSMTGFGRGKAEEANREVSIEIKTVNHRYLDVNLRLPRAMSFLEEIIRKTIQEKLTRGRVEVYASYVNNAPNRITVTLNEALAESYITGLKSLAEKHNLNPSFDISAIAGIEDIFTITEAEEDSGLLQELTEKALAEALDTLSQMREKEGSYLAEDIISRADLIDSMVTGIEKRSPLVVEEYRKKLEARIKELLKSTDLDEIRFNTEVAYFAERSNITEEIIRLKSHLNQLKQTMEKGGVVGRKLDFIVQEMNREINTIGSKSNDIEITGMVVDIKSEIEKIREQIQNIE
ncbi:MAG TPA: YicC family protein [Candidatus Atribacteria bacterium]|nr:YicC family protein [Candidatus Atribacteria bacterium]HPT77786.1 YicC family protein [Candidatus Atribacteria bacterium]